MKKLFLISTLLAGLLLSILSAKPLNYELTPVVGYNIPEDDYDILSDDNTLKSYLRYGAELQFNQIPVIHPELSFTYSLGEYDDGKETDIYRMDLNGVYQYDTQYVTPFIKAGIGFNMMSFPKDYYTTFINMGLGAKINFTQSIGLKLEFISITDHNSDDWHSNISFLTGLTFSFGSNQKKELIDYNEEDFDGIITNLDDNISDDSNVDMFQEEEQENMLVVDEKASLTLNTDHSQKNNIMKNEETIVEIESNSMEVQQQYNKSNNHYNDDKDNDGVSDYADKCIYTPPNTKVDKNGCKIDGDSDRDGIKDSIDKCMYTPLGARVYANGCKIDEDSDKDGIKNSIDECPNTPPNSSVNTKGCVEVDKNYKNIIQLNIEFQYKSFDLTASSKEEVLMLADFLNNNNTYDIRVIGYTDNRGSRDYNKKLSQKRANAIKQMLIKNGVVARKISSIGMGEANPIADNDSENGRAKNRRIEVELIKR